MVKMLMSVLSGYDNYRCMAGVPDTRSDFRPGVDIANKRCQIYRCRVKTSVRARAKATKQYVESIP